MYRNNREPEALARSAVHYLGAIRSEIGEVSGAIAIVGIVAALGVFFTCRNVSNLEKEVSSLHDTLRGDVQQQNVVGGPELDTYIESGGRRYFLEIDGVPLE